MKRAEALDDRASFRWFCSFSRSEQTPERTAFVRPRLSLVAHGLDKSLFDMITAQLKAKAIRVKPAHSLMRRLLLRKAKRRGRVAGSNTRIDQWSMASRRMSAPTPRPLLSRRLPSRQPTSMMERPVRSGGPSKWPRLPSTSGARHQPSAGCHGLGCG